MTMTETDFGVTLTGRVVQDLRLSPPHHEKPQRCTFEMVGRHSGRRVIVSASDGTARRIVETVRRGDVVTVTGVTKLRSWVTTTGKRESARVLFVESLTVHPREAR